MPDTVIPRGADADLIPSDPIGAEAIEAEPTREERLAQLRTVFVGGLLGLALLAASYAAAEIVLPILLAFILNLVFRPVLRVLLRARLPQPVAALIIVLSLVALFGGLAMLLSSPISGWISRLPETLPRIEQRVKVLSSPIKSLQGALQHVEGLAPVGGGGQQGAAAQGTAEGTPLARKILTQVWIVAGGAFTTLVALFFILVSGETFLRRLVEILPRFKTKRQVVDISQEIEDDLSIYLVAGLVMLDPLWMAFVPAGLYILIHVAEGETVTPMLLAHRFTVNPVLIMVGVFFWYWMWGVVGAILATPLLAITKIVCDRIEPLKPVGHFIGR